MKVGDEVLCIKDNDYMPKLIKGNKYIIDSKYVEFKYINKSNPTNILNSIITVKIIHKDMFYVRTENKFNCIFSLVRKPQYLYFYDYFSIKLERKLKLQKIYESRR